MHLNHSLGKEVSQASVGPLVVTGLKQIGPNLGAAVAVGPPVWVGRAVLTWLTVDALRVGAITGGAVSGERDVAVCWGAAVGPLLFASTRSPDSLRV
ncbi:MAG: hypothetical protein ACE5G8_10915 [Anaerolineae bacterium]